MKDNKGTPSKDTGAKNNNSDNDVDFKNNDSYRDTSSKKHGKSSVSNSVTDYRHSPKVEPPNPKATSGKADR